MKTFELGAVKMGGIHVYGRERTVCDFFRKRKQLGNDLALADANSRMKDFYDVYMLSRLRTRSTWTRLALVNKEHKIFICIF